MAKINKPKFSFKAHKALISKYLIALNAKRRQHYETNLHPFSGEADIKQLEELQQILQNLEYVGTWDGIAPNIQTNLFA
ncbi:hypothetical protein GCM10028807_50110 [Spirosoma daeguense]